MSEEENRSARAHGDAETNPSDQPRESGRRRFLRSAAALTGGMLAGHATAGYAASGGHAGGGNGELTPGDMGVSPHHAYSPGQGSMMYMEDHDMQGATTEPPGAPADDEVEYREFDLTFETIEHEILPGVRVPMFGFNGQVPGPMFRVQENDWIKVNVTNNTEEMHTIHWHGVDLIYTMDGVPMVNQDPIHPGETFVYRFQARPHGTRFYHCHFGTPLHIMAGLHGAFIIDSPNDPVRRDFPYTRDYTLALESFDIEFARTHMEEVLAGMKRVNELMSQRRLSHITHAFFKQYEDFVKAIEEGWRPPYTRGNAESPQFKPKFFGINGKAFPATMTDGHLKIRKGEFIRIRLINGGFATHHMHLHGHQFWIVAEDGNPLPYYRRANTVTVSPGKTWDIIVYGSNPGFWDFHDHNEIHATNNMIYPGGAMTMLEYEDMGDVPYVPSLSVNQ